MPIAALPTAASHASPPPSTGGWDPLGPLPAPEAREWRRQWTWRDALREPAEFWRSTFDRPLFYTEEGRQNLAEKAGGFSSGIAKSGPLGEALKELSVKAPRWFHFEAPQGAIGNIDTQMIETALANAKANPGSMTPAGVAYLEKILQRSPASRDPAAYVQRLPPRSDFGFEPGTLSTTTNPSAFGQTRPAIAGVPNVKVSEMAEGATPEGAEAIAKVLYPTFSTLRFQPRKLFSPRTREAIEQAASTPPFPDYVGAPNPVNESIEAGKRLLSTMDKPQSIADLAAMKDDLQKLHYFTPLPLPPLTEFHSKQLSPYTPAISEGNVGHYLRRLATRELAKEDVKAIAQIPQGDYAEFETTLVRPDAWKSQERLPPRTAGYLWGPSMSPTLAAQAKLSEKIERGGPYHGNPSATGRAVLLHLFRMMGR